MQALLRIIQFKQAGIYCPLNYPSLIKGDVTLNSKFKSTTIDGLVTLTFNLSAL